MPQETNQVGSKSLGRIPILFSVCLFGATVVFALWQFKSWSNIVLLAQFIFVVILLGIIGGALWEGFIGKGKGSWSNLAGIVFILALIWCSGSLLDTYNVLAREYFTTGEKTVKMLSLGIVGGFAVIMGKDIVRRYFKRIRSYFFLLPVIPLLAIAKD
jgi:hypothetical protein